MLLNLSLSLLNCTSIQTCTKGQPQTGSINSGEIKKKKTFTNCIRHCLLYFTFTNSIRHCLLLLHAGPITTAALKRVLLNIITERVLGVGGGGGGCHPTTFRYSETTSFPAYRVTDPDVIETWLSRKIIFWVFVGTFAKRLWKATEFRCSCLSVFTFAGNWLGIFWNFYWNLKMRSDSC